jgi:hypothetical protein
VRVTPEFYGYLERNFIPQNSERYREINLEFMGLILNKSGDRQDPGLRTNGPGPVPPYADQFPGLVSSGYKGLRAI